MFTIFLVKTIASTNMAFSCSMSEGRDRASSLTALDMCRVISCMEGREGSHITAVAEKGLSIARTVLITDVLVGTLHRMLLPLLPATAASLLHKNKKHIKKP